jgi:hypothetical protein
MTMNKPNNLSGTWKGHFSNAPEYEDDLYTQKVHFVLNLNSNGKAFEGTCVDVEGSGTHMETSLIKGALEKNQITFVKQYPESHLVDDGNGYHTETVIHRQAITYTGKYDAKKKIFTGEWEMTIQAEKYGEEDWVEEICTGKWEIQKED